MNACGSLRQELIKDVARPGEVAHLCHEASPAQSHLAVLMAALSYTLIWPHPSMCSAFWQCALVGSLCSEVLVF